ncbi:hypothetical protein [Mongoliitalea lutea]|uniref:Uncharacterized protein n=1 Tax=Mongoliitalea lutea TaxID=849756 RepID=A0A8J3D003_9BACT|nr:hypothetical protein [Mongoliitalea lutea]GHB44316.1 hypothetical protein GCM10008106_26690 [Mongoliitalea lutea]
MTKDELDIFEQIEESAKTKVDQKTKAGTFLEGVKRILLNIAGGKVSRLIVDVTAILLERLKIVELVAGQTHNKISELESQIKELQKTIQTNQKP